MLLLCKYSLYDYFKKVDSDDVTSIRLGKDSEERDITVSKEKN